MAENEPVIIRPQPGPQEAFLSSPADICIYGGAAGGGKTYGLLMEPLRHINNPKFKAALFRRTVPEITKPGGLWDTSLDLYRGFGGVGRESPQHKVKFPSGASISFSHLQYEADKYSWRGAQIALSLWDQLETFTESQFFYVLSRSRSDSGIAPYVRATCNPDPDSWLAKFLSYWINPETGYAIAERSGTVRWLVRIGEEIAWADTREELVARYSDKAVMPLSVMFIRAEYTDNPINLKLNPNYVAWLDGLDPVERERLKYGNWKIKAAAGTMFKRRWFNIVNASPAKAIRARGWDLAGTTEAEDRGADETASVRVARSGLGLYFVEDCISFKGSELEVERAIVNTAAQDGPGVTVVLFQDPGQAGKGQARRLARMLAGYTVKIIPANKNTGNKITMAKPVSSQAEARNIFIVRAAWNDLFLTRLENFPDGKLKDIIDALSGAFKILTEAGAKGWTSGDC